MKFPTNIKKEHILKAIHKIDTEGIPKNSGWTDYDVVYKGKLYPPKVLVSFANIFVNGSELDRSLFHGGLNTSCFKLLEKNGFRIKPKNSFMNEQVMIYEIKKSANINSDELFSPDRKYFYWNDKFYKKLKLGDFVFVVNTHSRYVLFSKLDFINIPVNFNGSNTSFSDLNVNYSVSGKYEKFIRLSIIKELKIPEKWEWKNLGSAEITYLNGNRISLESSENRISNISQLKYLSNEIRIEEILNACLNNFIKGKTITKPKQVTNDNGLSLKEIIEHVHAFITNSGFQYQYEEIANFYLSLRAKPFVILAGISGTGKTQLPRMFAASLGFSKEQIIQLPVRPDWTDSSDLLGYTSLDGHFIPKDLTLAIQKAIKNPDKPYFFILDEMNLARVEHYFSDYLSVIETREWIGNEIKTDPILREEILRSAHNKNEFTEMGLPQNLYLIGTVNMDETTHAFSKKVLDRANSIEMNEVDLNWTTNIERTVPKLANISNEIFKTVYLNSVDLNEVNKKSISDEMNLLQSVNKILEKADLHFAYRVRDEIAFYLIINKTYQLMNSNIAFDFQLVQKILPRIHGSSERVQTVLVDLLNVLEGKDFRSSNFEFSMINGKLDLGNLKYKRTSKKIIFMLKRFDDDRFTSFWL